DCDLILYEYMANGLRYLHSDCIPKVIHCVIKSNNVLPNERMQAHVGDFGLAKLIDISNSRTMSAVAGLYGYIAPGTGQSPIQPLEKGDLVNLVRRTINSTAPNSEMFDSRLNLNSRRVLEEMSLVLKIALFCTSESAQDRPHMREVISMLIDVRASSYDFFSSPALEAPKEDDSSLKHWR
ncbi:hypothetical protein ABZP36_001002, partial [Zizania latifolia]